MLLINNNCFDSYVTSIYPSELEIKGTTDSEPSVSYLDILLEKDLTVTLQQMSYIINVMLFMFFPSSASLTNVAIYYHHLLMRFMYLMLYIRTNS